MNLCAQWLALFLGIMCFCGCDKAPDPGALRTLPSECGTWDMIGIIQMDRLPGGESHSLGSRWEFTRCALDVLSEHQLLGAGGYSPTDIGEIAFAINYEKATDSYEWLLTFQACVDSERIIETAEKRGWFAERRKGYCICSGKAEEIMAVHFRDGRVAIGTESSTRKALQVLLGSAEPIDPSCGHMKLLDKLERYPIRASVKEAPLPDSLARAFSDEEASISGVRSIGAEPTESEGIFTYKCILSFDTRSQAKRGEIFINQAVEWMQANVKPIGSLSALGESRPPPSGLGFGGLVKVSLEGRIVRVEAFALFVIDPLMRHLRSDEMRSPND